MSNTDNGVLGPTYLEGFTKHIDNPNELLEHEWRRQLVATNGKTQFKIKYYGELHKGYHTLVVGTDFSASLLYAVEPTSGQEILLFDGCKHGYNALLCDEYSEEQIKNRPVDTWYKDKNGNELFDVTITTYNGIDFDDEFSEEVDEDGYLLNDCGEKISFEELKHNGFDFLGIMLTNSKGDEIELVSEELA